MMYACSNCLCPHSQPHIEPDLRLVNFVNKHLFPTLEKGGGRTPEQKASHFPKVETDFFSTTDQSLACQLAIARLTVYIQL